MISEFLQRDQERLMKTVPADEIAPRQSHSISCAIGAARVSSIVKRHAPGTFKVRSAMLLLSVTVMGMLSTSCFVLTSERRNEPVAARDSIKVNTGSKELRYSRLFQYPNFTLDVGVNDGPDRWQIVFLFYVLPLPNRLDYLSGEPVSVDVHLDPKSAEIEFDPRKVFFLGLGTNQVRVPPSSVWQDQRRLGTNVSNAVSITNDTTFHLEFSDWSQMLPDQQFSLLKVQPDRDLPFRFSIEGILDSGRTVVLPSITFRPTARIRPGFRLPY